MAAIYPMGYAIPFLMDDQHPPRYKMLAKYIRSRFLKLHFYSYIEQ